MGNTLDWGRTRYDEAFERQVAYVGEHLEGKVGDALIYTEHEKVFTMGKRKGAEENLLMDEAGLKSAGISVFETNRGGDITYHGPGQLVGYPVISLAKKRDLHAYLRDLEQVLINALGCMGLATARNPGKTGIWMGKRKIAAMGVAVKRWVTYHGFALNVNNDLSPFEGIVPCGISPEEGSVTSMAAELGSEVDMEALKRIISIEFWEIFGKD